MLLNIIKEPGRTNKIKGTLISEGQKNFGGNKMKNSNILIFVISTILLTSMMGNIVVSENREDRTFFFDAYHDTHKWETNPQYMIDGFVNTYASTTDAHDRELLTSNTCDGTGPGTIIKVEIRANGSWDDYDRDIILQPIFGGSLNGDLCVFNAADTPGWSQWFNISDDANSHEYWSWENVDELQCNVTVGDGSSGFTLFCSIVEIRVTYSV